jgi:hypothetical protein
MTPQDLCNAALKAIGALAAGETAAPDVMDDAYARLNRMIDQWALMRQTINGVQRFNKAVTANHNPYTIGVGGDFNQARPVWIDHVTLTLAGTVPIDLDVPLVGKDIYEAIPNKSSGGQIAQLAYYDLAGMPTGNLYFWLVPNDASVTIGLWLPVAITQFTSQTQALTLLPGYQAAIEKNLALELAPEWGRPIDPLLVQQAGAALGWVKRANLQINTLRCDPALLTGGGRSRFGDWYTGP